MVLIYTNLGVTPLRVVILVNVLLFICISSRMISSAALISGVPSPLDRGSYMSISASMQQISGGIAAAIAGMIVTESTDGMLQHIDILGYVLVATTLLTLVMMFYINRMVEVTAGNGSVAASAD
jgi:hypothetical protein